MIRPAFFYRPLPTLRNLLLALLLLSSFGIHGAASRDGLNDVHVITPKRKMGDADGKYEFNIWLKKEKKLRIDENGKKYQAYEVDVKSTLESYTPPRDEKKTPKQELIHSIKAFKELVFILHREADGKIGHRVKLNAINENTNDNKVHADDFVQQALVYFGADASKVSKAEWTESYNAFVARTAVVDPIKTARDLNRHFTKKDAIQVLGDVALSYPDVVDIVLKEYRNPQKINFFAYLYQYNRPVHVAQKLHDDQMKIAAYRLAKTFKEEFIELKSLLYLGSTVVVVLFFSTAFNYLFKLGYDYGKKWLFSNDVTTFSSLPETPLEWIMENIFGKRKKLPISSGKLIQTPERKQESDAWVARTKGTIIYNMKGLSSAQREAGGGAEVVNGGSYGDTGLGKTFTEDKLVMLLYVLGLVNVIIIDGANFSKLDLKEVTSELDRIKKQAWRSYVRSGKLTIVRIEEFDMMCPPRFSRKTSWKMRVVVSKLLAMFPRASSSYLMLRVTTNLNLTPGSPDRKKIDSAILNRIVDLRYIGKYSADLLHRILASGIKEYVKERGNFKVAPDAIDILASRQGLLAKLYPTPREQHAFGVQLMGGVFTKRSEKRVNKKNQISAAELQAVMLEILAPKTKKREEGEYGATTSFYDDEEEYPEDDEG